MHAFNRPKRSPRQVYVGHPHHPPAFRAEERLDYDVAAEVLERFEGGVGVLTDDGSGNSQARGLQASAGQVFVHACLESPRRVQDRHASRLESVQHVHSENHLLEGSWRHRPDHDGVKARQGIWSSRHTRRDAPKIHAHRFMARFACVRPRSLTCQPWPLESMAKRISERSSGREKRQPQHIWLNAAEGVTLPGGKVIENDLGGTEQHRIDLVEVSVVTLENLGKRRSVIGRGTRWHSRPDLRQLEHRCCAPRS